MVLFLKYCFTKRSKITFAFIVLILALQSCATRHPQYGKNIKNHFIQNETDSSKIAHTFFLIGDAGNANEKKALQTLGLLQNRLENSNKKSTLLFLGDNIYPKGFPKDELIKERGLAETKLKYQLQLSKNFTGKTIFIPGNHDWYSGITGLERQEKFINNYLNDKKAFLPQKSCGLEELIIEKNITLITIDSLWFL